MWVVNIALVLYGAATAFRDAFPPETQAKYQLHILLHVWSWQTWLALLAVANVFLALQGAVIAVRKREQEHAETQEKLRQKTLLPDIKGDILAVFWEFFQDPCSTGYTKHSRYYVKLRLVNYNDVPCTIDGYFITATDFGGLA